MVLDMSIYHGIKIPERNHALFSARILAKIPIFLHYIFSNCGHEIAFYFFPSCLFHFRPTSGKTPEQKNLLKFSLRQQLRLRISVGVFSLILNYHVYIRSDQNFRNFWHARAKNKRDC